MSEPAPRTGRPAPTADWRLRMLTCFGIGLSPRAPGTLGSLPPVVFALALGSLVGAHWTTLACIALLGVLASIVCVRFGAHGEEALGRKDPGAIVADEVAGQCIALLAVPWREVSGREVVSAALGWNVAMALLAFIAFRVFDIAKPPPIGQVQRVGGGWGILLDDLIAGVFAAVVVAFGAWIAMRAGW